jgi:hypothetical protein
MRADEHQAQDHAPKWVEVVAQQVQSIRFGVVQVVIHDGHVVQVEKTEKVRFAISADGWRNNREADRYPGG